MKKLLSLLLVVCLCFSACVMLASCGHEHTFKAEWSSDATSHWHACETPGCDGESDKADHTYSDGLCTVCKAAQTVGLTFQSNGDGTCKLTDAGNNADANVVIPSKSPEGDVVVEIAQEAFFGHVMTSVSIPSTVKTIGRSAFNNCANLASVVLPEGVTVVDFKAFENCSSLANVSFPASLTNIGESAFKNTALQFTDYEGATYLSDGTNPYAFLISELDSTVSTVNIHASTVLIADYAFANNINIKSVTIPASVKHVGEYAFGSNSASQYMPITSITLNEGLLTISKNAFSGCQINDIDIPTTVTYIGYHAFDRCFATTNANASIELPEAVTISEIFGDDCKITSITIPKSVVFEKVTEAGTVYLGGAIKAISYGGTSDEWIALNPSMKPGDYTLTASDGVFAMKRTYFDNVKK